ncbi:MAG TPA: tetratricopeptide repeat protein [Sunxiuqinia sp.]|nr:tetratricopeptide repeat protein [Sunxiuqinia sp.]
MKTIVIKLLILVTLFVGSVNWILAQDQPLLRDLSEVDELCKEALHLPVERGIEVITNNLDKCRGTTDEKECRLKMYFTVGYLYQLAANKERDNQMGRLVQAMNYYERAREIAPRDISILINLFLVNKALDNKQLALNFLDQCLEVDQANAIKYQISKGDLLYEMKDFRRAAENYKTAFLADANNDGLAWKVFYSYSQLPNPNEAFEALIGFSEELRNQHLNDLARSGFIRALNNALAVRDEKNAVESCVKWAETVAGRKTITVSYANELPDPEKWPSVCNVQLQELLKGSIDNLDQLGWWTVNDYRRHILASILLGKESATLLEGDAKKAVGMLEMALNVSPEFRVYEHDPQLKGYFPIRIDIAIELSRLYNRYPKLDLNHAKYDHLVQELFNQKGLSYLQNDLEAIQWSHTMLGLIYADRNVWTSGGYATNAIFQLEHAIIFQNRIQDRNPVKFKPIPGLYQLLAQGYQKNNQPKMEYRVLVDAAAGYLDLDNLKAASSLVKRLESFPGQIERNKQKLKEIKQITSMRFNIRNGEYNFKTSDVKSLANSITNSPLFTTTKFQNNSSFINRQRFKILADMGNKCTELNPSYKFPVFEVKALEYINREKALGNYQDINRLNNIERKFRKNLSSGDGIKLNQMVKPQEQKDNSKTWALNSGQYQTQIQVSNDLFVAGKVYENLEKENNDQTIDNLDQIKVRRGEVIIPQKMKAKTTINENLINQLEGVQKVRYVK